VSRENKLSIKKNLRGWLAGRKPKAEPPPASASPVPSVPAPEPAAVEPEVVAAIAVVLAVEVKMFMALQGRGFTFKGSAQGWSEWGRQLVRPFQGVR
jgi:hypothetical protein